MSEFLYLYRGGQRPTSSPEQMQQMMQKWLAWMKQLGDQGRLKEPGHPLDSTGRVVTGKQKTVTDGPYAEKDIVGGYSIVEARDFGHAVELSHGCPIFEIGGTVEIRPVMKIDR
jgi:hypothetical protein